MSHRISDRHIQRLSASLATWYGVTLTVAQTRDLITPAIAEEIGPKAAGITDTYIRELVAGELCRRLGLGRWPLHRDGQAAFAAFWERIKAAAAAAGYTVRQ